MKPKSYNLHVEPLEDRTLMSTCHVTRLSDTGAGKGFRGDLRYCINKVNAEPGPDVIDFTVTGKINLNDALPDLASDIDIQGPGASLLTVRRTGVPFELPYYRLFSVTAGATVNLSGLTMTNGFQSSGNEICGSGICNRGTLTLEDSIITGNQITGYQMFANSSAGGGVYNTGVMTIIRTLISQNKAWAFDVAVGAGVYNIGELTVIESHIVGNQAMADATSGVGLANYGSASIYSSTISGNEAALAWDSSVGGGVTNGGVMVVLNSTIVGNRAQSGAGLHTNSSADLTIVSHSTISNNTFGGSGGDGIACSTAAPFFMRNTIVAGHAGADVYCQLTSSNYNLIGDSSTGSGYSNTDLLDVDPLLGPLAYNGGPTPTKALLPGSPAIDAGDNTDAPEWDQRGPGFPRIVNGTIDIGAFEAQSSPIPAVASPSSRAGSALFALMLATADLDELD